MFAGNRKDYNLTPLAHEVPEWFCLDPQVWSPDLLIPSNYRLPIPEDTVKIYHAIGNFESRTDAATQRNIKSTHVYLPLIDQLKAEGHKVEMIFFQDVPNKKVRFYQAQADIVVDMLTFGWFGANIREALMLGKPSVCFLRPEWLETIRREIPEYIDELPVISATPENVHDILVDLIEHPEKRREIGRRSREFAVKWHSAEAGARRMDEIYSNLLSQTN
jgi:glycosyltransferase involved in cell wall biosynthesis